MRKITTLITLLFVSLISNGSLAQNSNNLFSAREGPHTFEGLAPDFAVRVAQKCTNYFEQEYIKANGKPSGYKWMDSKIVEVKDKKGNILTIGDKYTDSTLRYVVRSKANLIDENEDKLLGVHDCTLSETDNKFYLSSETMNFTLSNEEKITNKVGFDFTKLTNLEETTLFNECANIRRENKYTERADKILYDFKRIKDIGTIERHMNIDYLNNPKINYSLNSKWSSINDSGEKMASNISCILSHHYDKFKLENYVATQWHIENTTTTNSKNQGQKNEVAYKGVSNDKINDYFEACTFTINQFTTKLPDGKITHHKNLTWNERVEVNAYTIFKDRKLLKIKMDQKYNRDDIVYLLKTKGYPLDKDISPVTVQCALRDNNYKPGNISSLDLLLVVTSGGERK